MPRFIRAGKYNTEHETELPVIIGGGTSRSNRKDIMTMDWDGNAMFAGGSVFGGDVSADGDFSATGNAEIGGNADIGGDVNIDGKLNIFKYEGFYKHKFTRTAFITPTISTQGITVTNGLVWVNGKYLFVPYVIKFSMFFGDYSTGDYQSKMNFTILSHLPFSDDNTQPTNQELVTYIASFLDEFGYKTEDNQHLNTSQLIASNREKIFPVDGVYKNSSNVLCPIIGIYAYKYDLSQHSNDKIDIICRDLSETDKYKVYTWVVTNDSAPSGETWIKPAFWLVSSYYPH